MADVDVRAVYMRNWSTLDESGSMVPGSGGAEGCEWQKEWADVQKVCRQLGNMPVELVNLSREYWIDVFEPALSLWADGVTPNPDVACNRHIKFGALLDRIHTPWLATGHYARIRRSSDMRRAALLRAADASKDQSYYLSSVREDALVRSVFPLGDYLKSDVRALARKHALPTAENSESMGLCFVGERGGRRGFARFLDGYVEGSPGNIIVPGGRVIGQHTGLHAYTVGQRARVSGLGERYFVARKDRARNEITVVPGSTHPMLECTSLTSHAFSWISRDVALACLCTWTRPYMR
ncbi:tRNA-5-taurinomethyluridine 2-sulfurtransferase [Malassezia cuniculi]|uniref:tRNA-5-taurinomethyluridine 2-sulfurtransferase n=1 Tax=Malassezia cuniculi TaxID=948313 RepID=A0AAF0J5S0_9BASI|nr:tRNA-5-taurinomethyluridine 2-sulfurtransferase [Malassezia cuniculi]